MSALFMDREHVCEYSKWYGYEIYIGSTMTLCCMITCVICVYLSFGFKIKCFEIICGKCMDDCTCIEDRIERKIAKDLGLRQKTADESNDDDGLYKE